MNIILIETALTHMRNALTGTEYVIHPYKVVCVFDVV